jgi:hypothetical protein
MLFTPDSHEPLTATPWEEEEAHAAIRAIVADAEDAFDDGWAAHPEDEPAPEKFRTVYLGGAGVIRALDELARRGLVELRRDYRSYLEQPYVTEFGEMQPNEERSLLMGETGIRLVLQRVAPSEENTMRLTELIAANARDEGRELMWGSPGTMLAARAIGREDLWTESAAVLEGAFDPESGCWLQNLYGKTSHYLGPAHGFAGCALALGDDEKAASTARRYAIEDDGLVNWTPGLDEPLVHHRTGEIRVQWCHGAPGMVASLAHLARSDDEHTRLMVGGGELTWVAGPLAKGAGLCHGTAGNGYAFLALFERTGDELWLERARAFAMHAAEQVDGSREQYGQGRHTLWTGDPGVALYLADCIAGEGRLPLP